MSVPRVYVDFHNTDREGRLRLNCVGTIEDLQGIELVDGMPLLLHDEELEVGGTAEYSWGEQMWVAVIDWGELVPVPID